MDNPIDQADKFKADKKATVRFLKSEAERLADSMGKHFSEGFYQLAANDASQLSNVMTTLSQIDLT